MITTLRIKKKYIYFFVISFFLTFGLVSFLSSSTFKKIDPLEENCRKYSIKVDYKYQNSWNNSKKSNMHNILVEILNDELVKIIKNKNNYYFDGDKIVFLGKNCEKNSEKFLVSKENIENSIKSNLINFDKFLKSNDVLLSIQDYHVLYHMNSKKTFLGFDADIQQAESSEIVKNIIRFLVIIFILNLIFYFLNSIRFKID